MSPRLLHLIAALAVFVAPLAAAGASSGPADAPAKQGSHALDEVTVTARKFDRRTLEHVIIPRFVESHGAPSARIGQIGRWREDVCPRVIGLTARYGELVARRIAAVARSVGAPTRGVGRNCRVNVDIVFTPAPQDFLDHVAKSYPLLLGSSRSKDAGRFERAVQSWYLTGTRAAEGYNPPIRGLDAAPSSDMQIDPNAEIPFVPGMQADSPYGGELGTSGLAGSHLTKGLSSEFLHVLVIVDSRKVAALSLRAISDYLAVVSLTRLTSLDTCSELPSIIDLLSTGCGARAKPPSITTADTAFLRSLYSSDLEANLNIERGDLKDRMVSAIAGR